MGFKFSCTIMRKKAVSSCFLFGHSVYLNLIDLRIQQNEFPTVNLQRNHSFQNEIWNGSSSVLGIESTRMAREQIEPPKLATGKPLEKIERLFANLLLQLGTVRP